MRCVPLFVPAAMTLLVCATTVGLEAQEEDPTLSTRGGFIIGFGLGPGYASSKPSDFDVDSYTKVGFGFDFKIGGTAGKQWQVYYAVERFQKNNSHLSKSFFYYFFRSNLQGMK